MINRFLVLLLVISLCIGLLPGCTFYWSHSFTEPSTEAPEPSTEATEPSTEATEPSTEATEPSTEATEPSTEVTEPSTEATEPPTEATEPSTEATEPPTEATEPSTEATEPPTEPTTPPPTEPTEPPKEVFALTKASIVFHTEGQTATIYSGSIDLSTVVWGSENEAVATFYNGVVYAIGNGSTTVYAEYEGVRYTCSVYCNLIPLADREPILAPPASSENAGEFFNDALFIGDSVTTRLYYYSVTNGGLGTAQFIPTGSYAVRHALKDSMLVSYQGQNMTIEDAIAASGCKKIFIMLGMNDLGITGATGTMNNWKLLLPKIRSKNPDVDIYLQSMTPIFTGSEKGSLTNANADAYNAQLKVFAEKNGCHYVEIAPYLKDSTGGLAAKYCSDSYVHLTGAAAAVWTQVLRAYADTQMERVPANDE